MKLAETLHEIGEEFTGGWNFGPISSEHYSVADVIKGITKIIPDLKYKPDGNAVKPHEAKLLKLDISKSLAYLDWRPLLSFEETIQYTAEGYLAEKESNNVYKSRVSQIKNYAAKF